MRTLKRNLRTLFYAQILEPEELIDENGYHTGEFVESLGNICELKMNIGVEQGSFNVDEFGRNCEVIRELVTDDMNCPITEKSVFWIDVPISQPYNYVVKSAISKSLNSIKITVKRVKNETN